MVVRVRFHSILPETGCVSDVAVGTGVLWSPGFDIGYNYFNYLDCTWNLNTELGSFIYIRFTSFEVEYEVNCIYDYVEILDTVGSLGR